MDNTIIKTIFAVIGGFVGMFWGTLDGAMLALLAFIAIDYITGVLVAISQKALNSSVGFKGIAKKIFILLLVLVANVIDTQIIGGSGVLRGLVIAFYLANEGISILENAGKLGVPYPQKLKQVIEQLNQSNNSQNDKSKSTLDEGGKHEDKH